MKQPKDYLTLGLGILVLVLILLLNTKHCSGPTPGEAKPIYIKGKETIIRDTVFAPAKKTDNPWVKPNPPKYPQPVDSLCKSHNEYTDSIVDSNQVIYWKIRTTGRLDSAKIDYKLFVPLSITNIITRVDTIKYPGESNKWALYGGMEVGHGEKGINISPTLDLALKNKTIGYRYGATDNSHNIKVGVVLFRKRQ